MTTEGISNPKLYELRADYQAIKVLLQNPEAMGDELDEALQVALDALVGAIRDKTENIGKLYLQMKAEADFIGLQAQPFEEEVKRLRARETTRRNQAGRLLDYLKRNLAALGDDTQKVVTPLVTITLSKRPEKDNVVIVDESAVPITFKSALLRMPAAYVTDSLRTYWMSSTIDKKTLNEAALQDGANIPGVAIEPGTRTLKIY